MKSRNDETVKNKPNARTEQTEQIAKIANGDKCTCMTFKVHLSPSSPSAATTTSEQVRTFNNVLIKVGASTVSAFKASLIMF